MYIVEYFHIIYLINFSKLGKKRFLKMDNIDDGVLKNAALAYVTATAITGVYFLGRSFNLIYTCDYLERVLVTSFGTVLGAISGPILIPCITVTYCFDILKKNGLLIKILIFFLHYFK